MINNDHQQRFIIAWWQQCLQMETKLWKNYEDLSLQLLTKMLLTGKWFGKEVIKYTPIVLPERKNQIKAAFEKKFPYQTILTMPVETLRKILKWLIIIWKRIWIKISLLQRFIFVITFWFAL